MNLQEISHLLGELNTFQQSSLYKHFREHFRVLYDLTVETIISFDLKGPESLYTREAIIGEARAIELQAAWFDILHSDLEEKKRELTPQQ